MRTAMAAELEGGGKPIPADGEPEPVGGPDEEPDPVWIRRVRGGRAVVDRWRTWAYRGARDCGADGGRAGMRVKARL